jgi:hypothetical protein
MWMPVFLLALYMGMFVSVFIFMLVRMGVYNPFVLVLMFMPVLKRVLVLVDMHLFRLMLMCMSLHIMLALYNFDHPVKFVRTGKHT